MNIHEYQAKAILRNFGVPVPEGHVVYNSNAARDWAKRLGEGPWAVKAQIHAGGRGKGGGVKIAKTADEVKQLAREMFGMTLVTHQTGPEGKLVRTVLIEEALPIDRELYLGVVLDRSEGFPVMMASKFGGMEIEEISAESPDSIVRATVEPAVGLQDFQCREIAFALGLDAPSFWS